MCRKSDEQTYSTNGLSARSPTRSQNASRLRDGRRLTASYINFYLANGAIIVPIFGDSMDAAAFHAIQAAFPDRRIVEIEVADLIYGGGGIHCITQQQPKSDAS